MNDDVELNFELWLQYLMAVLPDAAEREKLIQQMSERSGITSDKVKLVLEALAEYLLNETRRN